MRTPHPVRQHRGGPCGGLGASDVLAESELTAGERTPRPGEDDTQTVERIRRIVEEKWGNDPGPPERWPSQFALAVNDLMRRLGDPAAASLAYSAYEDADDTETIDRSCRNLAERWGVMP